MRREVAIGLAIAGVTAKAALGLSTPDERADVAPTGSASHAPSAGPPPTARQSDPTRSEAALHACLETLQQRELAQVERSITRDYRLAWHDAQDIARDAMLRVCVAHAERSYQNLGAVYLTAARREAMRGAMRRRRFPVCPVDEQLPACSRSPDDLVRAEQEARLVEAALCKEDLVTQRIVRLRATDGASFEDLGRDHGLGADQARTRYHNGLRRVQRRVAEACGG